MKCPACKGKSRYDWYFNGSCAFCKDSGEINIIKFIYWYIFCVPLMKIQDTYYKVKYSKKL
jgi:hypothetical protein